MPFYSGSTPIGEFYEAGTTVTREGTAYLKIAPAGWYTVTVSTYNEFGAAIGCYNMRLYVRPDRS